ncbi:hypothetical protein Dimus_016825, partial [Dionaea muscipula]
SLKQSERRRTVENEVKYRVVLPVLRLVAAAWTAPERVDVGGEISSLDLLEIRTEERGNRGFQIWLDLLKMKASWSATNNVTAFTSVRCAAKPCVRGLAVRRVLRPHEWC